MGVDQILEAILEALDRGESPDAAMLRERFPGQHAEVERLLKATARYQHLMRAVRGGDPAEPELARGDRLGDFEVEALIGRGGMGSVWRARQLSLGGRQVALKVLPAAATDPSARTRFQREALLLADLHHPSLAEVHGIGEERGLVYFAMRLVDGPTLREVIERNGRPGSEEARRRCVAWMCDVAGALAAVHAAGLVHRDVKPSNVLIDLDDPVPGNGWAASPEDWPRGRAVLVDFGLVRPVQAESRTLTGIGVATLPYAPGEQILGRDIDARADVFSLGVTLHDLLAGRLPQAAGRAAARGQASLSLAPLSESAPDVDADLQAVVAKATDPDARWRYADAGSLHADLVAWLADRPVSARRLRPLERGRRWVRTHPERILQVLGIAVAVAVLVLLSGTWADWRRAARDANAAVANGDLGALARAATALPAWGLQAWVSAEEGRRGIERLRAGDAQDPLVRAVRLLEARDPEGALLAASTQLRVHGYSNEPILMRFLAAAVDGTLEGMRSPAIRYAARLLHEREPTGLDDLQATGTLLAALHRVESGRLSLDEQLDAWAALAGCGSLSDAERAAVEARALHASGALGEEWRMRMIATERPIRRDHRLGRLEAERVQRILEVVAPMLRDVHAAIEAGLVPWKVIEVHEKLSRALVLAATKAGLPIDPSSLVCAGHSDVSSGSSGVILREAGVLRAAVGDATGVDRLLALCRETGLTCDTPHALGWACAVLGDPVRIEVARSVLGKDARDTLERGIEAGRAALVGCAPEYDPDPDTLLGAIGAGAGAWQPAVVTGCWSSADFAAWWHVDGNSPPRAPLHPGFLAYGLTLPVARWDFGEQGVTLVGSARAAAGFEVEIQDRESERCYLRLAQPGASLVTLSFDLDGPELDHPWKLVISHQRSSRLYLPYKGQAPVEVMLDGSPLGRELTAAFVISDQSVEIPPERLPPGRHSVEIRLAREATTADWIYRVELRRPLVP